MLEKNSTRIFMPTISVQPVALSTRPLPSFSYQLIEGA